MSKIVHPVAGTLAFLTIATFWLATALSELFAAPAGVAAVKLAIPWGFLLLVPALAAAGGSGFALAQGGRRGLIGAKLKRMPLIVANGVCNMLGQYWWTRSIHLAPTSAVVPFQYLSLIWAMGFGFALWGDVPTIGLLVGSAIVVGSGLFLLWHETRPKMPKLGPP